MATGLLLLALTVTACGGGGEAPTAASDPGTETTTSQAGNQDDGAQRKAPADQVFYLEGMVEGLTQEDMDYFQETTRMLMENFNVNDAALEPYFLDQAAWDYYKGRFGTAPLENFEGMVAYPYAADDKVAIMITHLYNNDPNQPVYPLALEYVKEGDQWKLAPIPDRDFYFYSNMDSERYLGPEEALASVGPLTGFRSEWGDYSFRYPELTTPGKRYFQDLIVWQDPEGNVNLFFFVSNGSDEVLKVKEVGFRVFTSYSELVNTTEEMDIEVAPGTSQTYTIEVPQEDVLDTNFIYQNAEFEWLEITPAA